MAIEERDDTRVVGYGASGRPTGKLVIGVIAIAAGTLFLLDQRGIVDIRSLWRFWPVVFILVGIGKLFERNNRDKIMGAGMMFLIGGAWLSINLGYFHWSQVWPIGLIIVGVLMILQTLRAGRTDDGASTGPLNSYAVFSSVEKNINDRDFTGGHAQTVFGSVEIDLTRADMQGEKANVDVNVVFGSVEMRVPETWKVEVEAGAVFGSCENKTRVPLPSAIPKTLVVRGDVVFGSVEIRN